MVSKRTWKIHQSVNNTCCYSRSLNFQFSVVLSGPREFLDGAFAYIFLSQEVAKHVNCN